jgi:hypothetical protein
MILRTRRTFTWEAMMMMMTMMASTIRTMIVPRAVLVEPYRDLARTLTSQNGESALDVKKTSKKDTNMLLAKTLTSGLYSIATLSIILYIMKGKRRKFS